MEQIKRLGRRIRLVHQKDFAWDSLVPINLNGLDPDALKLKPGEVVGLDGNSDYAARGGMTAQEVKTAEMGSNHGLYRDWHRNHAYSGYY